MNEESKAPPSREQGGPPPSRDDDLQAAANSTHKPHDDAALYSANIVRLVDEKKLLLEQNETTLKHKDALTEALVDAQSRLAALAHLPEAHAAAKDHARALAADVALLERQLSVSTDQKADLAAKLDRARSELASRAAAALESHGRLEASERRANTLQRDAAQLRAELRDAQALVGDAAESLRSHEERARRYGAEASVYRTALADADARCERRSLEHTGAGLTELTLLRSELALCEAAAAESRARAQLAEAASAEEEARRAEHALQARASSRAQLSRVQQERDAAIAELASSKRLAESLKAELRKVMNRGGGPPGGAPSK